jgi:hypothetical protein
MPLTVCQLDALIAEALTSLYGELLKTRDPETDRSWQRREQEIVSLFAFGHLAPLFQREKIDIALLRIEGRVRQVPTESDPRKRAARDLVIFRDRLDTLWRPSDPFAVMEWKLSTQRKTPKRILTGDKDSVATDVIWLERNFHYMEVGYSVFVRWPNWNLKITCERICNDAGRCQRGMMLELPSR